MQKTAANKERKKLSNRIFESHGATQNRANRENVKTRLLDYLNCTFRTLSFTRSADKTLVNFGGHRLRLFDFVDADGARVHAGLASGAFRVINYYLYHVVFLVFQFQKST
jgi:hypothetical protein